MTAVKLQIGILQIGCEVHNLDSLTFLVRRVMSQLLLTGIEKLYIKISVEVFCHCLHFSRNSAVIF